MEKTEIQVTFNEKALLAFDKIVRRQHFVAFSKNMSFFFIPGIILLASGVIGFIYSFQYSFILQLLSIAGAIAGAYLLFMVFRYAYIAWLMFGQIKSSIKKWKVNQKNPPDVKFILQGNFFLYVNERTDKTSEMRIDETNFLLLEEYPQGFVIRTYESGISVVKEAMSPADYQKVLAHLRMIREKSPDAI